MWKVLGLMLWCQLQLASPPHKVQSMWSVLRMDLHQQKSGHLGEAEKCGWERGDQGRPRQRRGSTSVCRTRPAQRDREVKQGLWEDSTFQECAARNRVWSVEYFLFRGQCTDDGPGTQNSFWGRVLRPEDHQQEKTFLLVTTKGDRSV